MSDTTPKMISVKILRAFRDDGTKTSYAPSKKVEQIEEGIFDNYKAAGLVEAAEVTEATANPTDSTAQGKTKPTA
jgi:tetrahydromethanopterin S-methyltransferase subunit H